jgi:hypothetical protein
VKERLIKIKTTAQTKVPEVRIPPLMKKNPAGFKRVRPADTVQTEITRRIYKSHYVNKYERHSGISIQGTSRLTQKDQNTVRLFRGQGKSGLSMTSSQYMRGHR